MLSNYKKHKYFLLLIRELFVLNKKRNVWNIITIFKFKYGVYSENQRDTSLRRIRQLPEKQSHYVAVTKVVEIASRNRQMPTLRARNDEVGFSE